MRLDAAGAALAALLVAGCDTGTEERGVGGLDPGRDAPERSGAVRHRAARRGRRRRSLGGAGPSADAGPARAGRESSSPPSARPAMARVARVTEPWSSRGFPRPPSYHEPRLRAAAPEHVVGVITHGVGRMLPHAERVRAGRTAGRSRITSRRCRSGATAVTTRFGLSPRLSRRPRRRRGRRLARRRVAALEPWSLAFVVLAGSRSGSLGLLTIGHLLSEEWLAPIRSEAEAAALTAPLLAATALPLGLHLAELYPWAEAGAVPHCRRAATPTSAPPSSSFAPSCISSLWNALAVWIARTPHLRRASAIGRRLARADHDARRERLGAVARAAVVVEPVRLRLRREPAPRGARGRDPDLASAPRASDPRAHAEPGARAADPGADRALDLVRAFPHRLARQLARRVRLVPGALRTMALAACRRGVDARGGGGHAGAAGCRTRAP